MPKPAANKLKNEPGGLHVSWMTVSYRSVVLSVIIVLAVILGAIYITFPAASTRVVDTVKTKVGDWLDQLFPTKKTNTGVVTAQEAHFTNLDGTVEVRRKDGNDWERASYNLPLEKGDTIRTSEGMAKVTFPDGTSYVVKPDSYIVVEENSSDSVGNSNVVVNVPSGTIDIHKPNFGQGNRQEVLIGDGKADLKPGSAVIVNVNAQEDQHAIVVKAGGVDLTRKDGEKVDLGPNDKASYKGEGSHTIKEKEIVPPTLIAPADQLPFSLGPDGYTTFTWSPVDDAKSYHLVVSKNAFMTPAFVEKTANTTTVRIEGLTEGTYYWSVRSVNAAGKESPESNRNKFSLVPPSNATTVELSLEDLIKTGHTVEIIGKTEPNARVIVNGEEVPVVDPDGSFTYYLTGLAPGSNTITITAQNSTGSTTKNETVEIP